MICRNCGKQNEESAIFCSDCGTALTLPEKKGGQEVAPSQTEKIIKCSNCGADILETAKYCSKCGQLNKERPIKNPTCPQCHVAYPEGTKFCLVDGKILIEGAEAGYTEEQEVYKKAFLEFDKAGGFKSTWSWVGLFFGGIWYLVKGMWAKGLIIIGITLISAGYGALPLWIYCAVCGKYDYYLWKVKRKQLW